MTKTKKKMTPAQLEWRINRGIKKLDLELLPNNTYFSGRFCCAIGGAFAYAATSRRELAKMINGNGGDRYHRAAEILNHNLTYLDMYALEQGFEGGVLHDLDVKDPFFVLGQRLRAKTITSIRELRSRRIRRENSA